MEKGYYVKVPSDGENRYFTNWDMDFTKILEKEGKIKHGNTHFGEEYHKTGALVLEVFAEHSLVKIPTDNGSFTILPFKNKNLTLIKGTLKLILEAEE
jgi:hypothetical protein